MGFSLTSHFWINTHFVPCIWHLWIFHATFLYINLISMDIDHWHCKWMYENISTCKKNEFYLFKNKVIRMHMWCVSILHWTKNWLDVLLVHEDIAINSKQVPLKLKSILCNTLGTWRCCIGFYLFLFMQYLKSYVGPQLKYWLTPILRYCI